MSFEFFIGLKYLRSKRKQTFISVISLLSVLGVIIGVMALVIVISVMSGVEKSFRERLLGLEPNVVLLKRTPFTNYEKAEENLKNIKNIKSTAPFIYSQVMLKSKESTTGGMLRGIKPDAEHSCIQGFSPKDIEEKLPKRNEEDFKSYIILGRGLAESLDVKVGDTVYVISTSGVVSPIGKLPSLSRFEVSGTFKSGLSEYDDTVFYINLNDAQRILNMKNSISGIGMWLDDIYAADKVSSEISSIFSYPYATKNWMELNHSLFAALKLEKTATFIVLILIVLVAAFNIASSLIMMVMEKTKDIAILKAMGAKNSSIQKIFVINGLIIGTIGTFIGVVLGIIGCFLLQTYQFIELPEAYPFTTIPVDLNFLDVFVITISAILICFIASIYPAKKAAKLNPVEAIRYA